MGIEILQCHLRKSMEQIWNVEPQLDPESCFGGVDPGGLLFVVEGRATLLSMTKPRFHSESGR